MRLVTVTKDNCRFDASDYIGGKILVFSAEDWEGTKEVLKKHGISLHLPEYGIEI